MARGPVLLMLLLWAFCDSTNQDAPTVQQRPIAALRGVSLEPRPLAVLSGLTASVQLRYACLPSSRRRYLYGPPTAEMNGTARLTAALRAVAQVLVRRLGPTDDERLRLHAWARGTPPLTVPAMLAPLTVATRACTSRSGATPR